MTRQGSTEKSHGVADHKGSSPGHPGEIVPSPDRSHPKVRQLLDAARTLFLEQAYDSVSTDAIARKAKVSKATLYVYFPSKEALFAALVAELCERTADEIWNSASTWQTVEEALRAIAQNYVEMFITTDAIALYRSIIAQVPRFPELGRLFYESGPKILQQRIEGFLREASDQGHIYVPDPQLAAAQFLQLVAVDVPLTHMLALDPAPSRSIGTTIESGVALFLRGYRTQDAANIG